jgi:Flp pilus assembly pilin Flp
MNVFKSRKGQGTTEYIVILAVLVVGIMAFWPTLKAALTSKFQTVAGDIGRAR